MFGYLKTLLQKKYQDLSISFNLRAGNYRDVIWILGDGRSGTTWLLELLDFDGRYRKMFEPVHPFFVADASHLPLNAYMTTANEDSRSLEMIDRIFSGRLRNPWVDRYVNGRFLHRGLLIKDVHATLLAAWVGEKFPKIKKVVIIRNPIPVALSKMKKSNWTWMEDPKGFLDQELLVRDHLDPFRSFISGIEKDCLLRQVLIWAILHFVLFRQLQWQDACFVFYEDLFLDPRKEMAKVFSSLGLEKDLDSGKFLDKVATPSMVSGSDSNMAKKDSPITQWKTEVSTEVRKKCHAILRQFGLGKIYGPDFGEPNRDELKKIMQDR